MTTTNTSKRARETRYVAALAAPVYVSAVVALVRARYVAVCNVKSLTK